MGLETDAESFVPRWVGAAGRSDGPWKPVMGWFFVAEGEKKDMKRELAQDRAVHPEVAKTSKGSPK